MPKKNTQKNTKKKTKKQLTKKTVKTTGISIVNHLRGGIDIGKDSVYICIGLPDGKQEVREFLTFTEDLNDMAKWIKENDVQSVAMESTGVYWSPIYDILTQHKIECVLVNPYFVRMIPDKKTDVHDCQWLQELHAHGLLKGSFRLEDEALPFRTYVLQRTALRKAAARQLNLAHKYLEYMNIKLSSVITSTDSKTCMDIIRAIIDGERDPTKLARFRHYSCSHPEEDFVKALTGNFRNEYVFMLRQTISVYDMYQAKTMECEVEIEKLLKIFSKEQAKQLEEAMLLQQKMENPTASTTSTNVNSQDSNTASQKNANKPKTLDEKKRKATKVSNSRKTSYCSSPYYFCARQFFKLIFGVDLMAIPGIGENFLMTLLAVVGPYFTKKFKSYKEFCNYVGVAPNNKITGGKVVSSRTRNTNNLLKEMAYNAGRSMLNAKGPLGDLARKLKARLGPQEAIVAIAHKLLRIIYAMVANQTEFDENTLVQLSELAKTAKINRHKKALKELGVEIEIKTTL